MNSTEKGAKNIMKKFAPNLQNLKNQADYIRETYSKIQKKFELGEITPEEVKQLFLNFYKSNFNSLLPEVRSQIEAYFNQSGIKY
jgi:predicted DNA-binding helix-hairpin-helix protein